MEKPKVKKGAKFKSIRIPGSLPGPKRGRKPKGERALTSAERSAKTRAELKQAGASSQMERIRGAVSASTTMDVKKQRKAKKLLAT